MPDITANSLHEALNNYNQETVEQDAQVTSQVSNLYKYYKIPNKSR